VPNLQESTIADILIIPKRLERRTKHPITMTVESNEQNKIEITFFKPSDADAIFELRLAVRATDPYVSITNYEHEASKTREEKMEWLQEALRENPTHMFVLAKSKNIPVGMIGARDKGEGVWELHGVYVRPEFRGKHIGDNMLRAMIGKIREHPDAKKMTFEAETENIPAMEMYKKFGFEIIGTHKKIMGDGREYDKSIFSQELDRIQS
jgi:ribosomal protein S18 acetylase RimI-like enzyme